MRLRRALFRRLQCLLPPGLAAAVKRVEPLPGWAGSPLAGLAPVSAQGRGCLRLTLDAALADAIRRCGIHGLPALEDGTRWQALGRRGLCFKAAGPRPRQVMLCDALHGRLWLLWREPGPVRRGRGY